MRHTLTPSNKITTSGLEARYRVLSWVVKITPHYNTHYQDDLKIEEFVSLEDAALCYVAHKNTDRIVYMESSKIDWQRLG